MNFDEAINAHVAWKMKLSVYLRHPNGSIKSTDAGADNICELGRWINGEGAIKYSETAEFIALKHEHTNFHKCAGSVIEKADNGSATSQDIALGSGSEFSQTSSKTVAAIMAMKRKSAINT